MCAPPLSSWRAGWPVAARHRVKQWQLWHAAHCRSRHRCCHRSRHWVAAAAGRVSSRRSMGRHAVASRRVPTRAAAPVCAAHLTVLVVRGVGGVAAGRGAGLRRVPACQAWMPRWGRAPPLPAPRWARAAPCRDHNLVVVVAVAAVAGVAGLVAAAPAGRRRGRQRRGDQRAAGCQSGSGGRSADPSAWRAAAVLGAAAMRGHPGTTALWWRTPSLQGRGPNCRTCAPRLQRWRRLHSWLHRPPLAPKTAATC